MTVKTNFYRVVVRFARLFPDPTVFEDPAHLVVRYLVQNGLPRDKASYIHQSTDEIVPVGDGGSPALASGTAKYRYEGRTIVAEYMGNASLRLEYVDFGTGLSPADHSKLWKVQRLGDMRFELREFNHQSQTLNIPDTSDLYRILKERVEPTTISSIELSNISDTAFKAAVAYLETQLRQAASNDKLEVEVYAARDLSPTEKRSLEKRLTRESTKATVYVILSKPSNQESPTAQADVA